MSQKGIDDFQIGDFTPESRKAAEGMSARFGGRFCGPNMAQKQFVKYPEPKQGIHHW